jgi:NADPH:quinone reductase-like Zn-dependent oxidoreductase
MRRPWTAYWTVSPRQGALISEPARSPEKGEALVRALRSGISRGTELLVYRGQVPSEVAGSMRAPFQSGDWPGPVKYGYLSVGVVEEGPEELLGRRVFCLYPHQDHYVVPASALTPIPDGVPSDRAVLAGAVETGINALWDAGPRMGDRVGVIGAGMIGGTLATLLSSFPLARLQLIDVNPARAALADRLGLCFATPDEAADSCDLIFHTSATEGGLARGLQLLGEEGELIELSWYGSRSPRVPLGGSFHAHRLTIRASQVGVVPAARRVRRTTADRLALAMEQLKDPVFDAFLTDRSPFSELPETMHALDRRRDDETLCQVIEYPSD